LGMGVTVAPLTTSVMGSVPQHSAGVASGINNAVARASGVLATAIMGGIALIVFSNVLTSRSADVTMPADARDTLLENAHDLGNTAVPGGLDGATADAVQQTVARSFVDTFRLLAWIGACMCWLSALLAGFIVESKLRPPEELLPQPGTD